jgi:hypothetical protein
VPYIEVLPPVPYREALAEMLRADGLLIMQASNCNEQIPAKLYEYLRARRPVLALTDPTGDTAATLRRAGIDAMAPLDNAAHIADLLRRFLHSHQTLAPRTLADETHIQAASRRGRAGELAALLDSLSRA